jgi:hypothetical protein
MIRVTLAQLIRRLSAWLFSFPTGPTLVLIQGVAAWTWWVAGSYFGLDTFYSRSFLGNDSWCDPPSQGLGVHCWGDYYSLTLAFTLNPESPYLGEFRTAYAPAGLIFIQLFNLLGLLLGQPAMGLVIYLVLMMSTIGWSVWKGTLGLKLDSRILIFATLTFFAPPVLMVVDRGNTVGFLIPLLIWYFYALRVGKYSQLAVSVALMSIIKPHFGVLVLALFVSGKVLVALKSALMVAIVNILPFIILWGSESIAYIEQWLLVFFGYQGVSSPANPFPTNISFSHSLFIIATGLNNLGLVESSPFLSWVESNYGLVGFAVGFLVLLLVSGFRAILTQTQISILVISCISLLSGTTYMYYAVFAIPILLTFIRLDEKFNKRQSSAYTKKTGDCNKSIDIILWFASISTLIQFPIFALVQGTAVVTTNSMIGGFWLLAYLIIAVVLFIEFMRTRASKFGKTPTNPRN